MPAPGRRAVTAVLAPATLAVALVMAPAAPAATPSSPAPSASGTQHQPGADQMTMQMMQMARRYAAALRSLQGAAFEQAFTAGQVPHQQMAVELTHGSRPQLKALAGR